MGDADDRDEQIISFPQIDDPIISSSFSELPPMFAFERFVVVKSAFLKIEDFGGDQVPGIGIETKELLFRLFVESDVIHRSPLF